MNSQTVIFDLLWLGAQITPVSCTASTEVPAGISGAIDGTTYTDTTDFVGFLLDNATTSYGIALTNVTLYLDTATHIAELVSSQFLIKTHRIRHGAGVRKVTQDSRVPSLLPSILSKLTCKSDV